MANLLGPILGMMALGAAGGAANQIVEQQQQRQKQTSEMVKTMLMAGIQQGDVGFVDDPNVQKLLKNAGFPKETPMIAKTIAQAMQPAIQLKRQLAQTQLNAAQRAERQGALAEQAQQYVPGVIAPRTGVSTETPAAGMEGAAVGARVEPVQRAATTPEIRRSINDLNLPPEVKRAVLADPLVQSEFAESLQRDINTANKATQFAIAEMNNQGRLAAALIRSGGKTQDEALKGLPNNVIAEIRVLQERDKAQGGTGDLKSGQIEQAVKNATIRAIGKYDATAQILLGNRNAFAEAQGMRTVAVANARTFIANYAKVGSSLNELQRHATTFRELSRRLSVSLPAEQKTNLLKRPVNELLGYLQAGEKGQLIAALEGYRSVLGYLEYRAAFGGGAQRGADRFIQNIEASIPNFATDTLGTALIKEHRLEQSIGAIGKFWDSERTQARGMLESAFPTQSRRLLPFFDRGDFPAIDSALKGFESALNTPPPGGSVPQFQGVEEE